MNTIRLIHKSLILLTLILGIIGGYLLLTPHPDADRLYASAKALDPASESLSDTMKRSSDLYTITGDARFLGLFYNSKSQASLVRAKQSAIYNQILSDHRARRINGYWSLGASVLLTAALLTGALLRKPVPQPL